MKFILRVLGTWFLGLALVLVIVDGAKSLAANTITTTSLAETWNSMHAASWAAVNEAMAGAFASVSWQEIVQYVFACPGWAIFGGAGLVLLLLGRRRMRKQYIATY